MPGTYNDGTMEDADEKLSFSNVVRLKRFTSKCRFCPKGYFSRRKKSADCQPCGEGHYQPNAGHVDCIKWYVASITS
jgi:hypothetical protein